MIDKTDILDFDKKYGFTQIPNVLVMNMNKLQISGNEFALLTIIRMFAYQKDNSFPSLNSLINISGFSRQGIINIIKSLEKKGYLIIARKLNSKNLYSFKPLNELLEKIIIQQSDRGVVKNIDYPSQKIRPQVVKNFDPNNNINNNNTHTYLKQEPCQAKKSVCEDLKSKKEKKPHTPLSPLVAEIKKLNLFKNEDEKVINNLANQYLDSLTAAKYLNYQSKKGLIEVKKPLAYLISTLKNKLYDDVDELEKKELEKNKIESANLLQKIKEEEKDDLIDRQVDEYIKTLPEQKYLSEIKKIKLKYYRNLAGTVQEGMAILKFKSILRKKIRKGYG
ncbi:MAG: helix-turn-helix domain-containing protein [bacterium]